MDATRITDAPATPIDSIVTTVGEFAIDGRSVRYTAQAGQLPIYNNETGELAARVFVVAYTVDRAPGEDPRPLTFVWNGGPGSNSWQVHLQGFGPKVFETPPTFPDWRREPMQIADNPDSWLAASDLVFVDPVGTGYSRPASEKYRDLLLTGRGDTEVVAEAIRIYLTRCDAFDVPIFLAGESYGTFRAMAVAQALERRRTRVCGVFLISGFYDVGQRIPPSLDTALQVPMYTATAHYHRKLPAELQDLSQDEAMAQSVDWARREYAPALDRRMQLSKSERSALIEALNRYSGIESRFIDEQALAIDKVQFTDHLLEDRGLEVGRFDMRMTSKRRNAGTPWSPHLDPSLKPMINIMQGTSVPAIRYMRNVLEYRTDLLYQGPFGEGFYPLPLTPVAKPTLGGDWLQSSWDHGEMVKTLERHTQYSEIQGDSVARWYSLAAQQSGEIHALADAMERNPDLLVYNVRGLYDMSFAAMDEAVARSPSEIRARVRNRCITAGHMLYTDVAARGLLRQDFENFVRDATFTQRSDTLRTVKARPPER